MCGMNVLRVPFFCRSAGETLQASKTISSSSSENSYDAHR
jgi:hypothetical protein